MLLPMSRF